MNLLIPEIAAAFMLTFARVGTLVMLMPGIGERMISPRARLGLAALITLALYPYTRTLLPPVSDPMLMATVLIGEIVIGLVLGLSVRMVVAALQTAGNIIAQQLGLAFAMSVDPSMGGQQASIGNLLTLLGITMIFVSDLHHLAIGGIYQSYTMLPPANVPAMGEASKLALEAASKSFTLAVQMSAPFLVFGILFNLGLGVLARLMPQLQIFFIGIPATILIGMIILLGVLGVMMGFFTDTLSDFIMRLSFG